MSLIINRIILINIISHNFKDYSREYFSFIIRTSDNGIVFSDDLDRIRKRILPNFWKTVVNPFKWTETQVSEDDELLKRCINSWEINNKKDNARKILAEQSFNERYSKWKKENIELKELH